ncbi:MAG: RNA methyltransferase, partial [Candidatus Sumerlaeota bacterium]|nr:RNA methyltransferase [Candidatus Sumerlaeota bacterium]
MPLPLIESPHNPRIMAAAKLLDRKARARTELYLIEGWRFVRTALEMQAPVEELYLTRSALEREGAGLMMAGLMASKVPVFEVSEAAIKRLSDTVSPQGVVAVVRRLELSLDQLRLSRRPLVLIADAVSDPGNLGAMIRIAGAAAADALLLISGCCDWTSPKVLRASMGSVFQVPL